MTVASDHLPTAALPPAVSPNQWRWLHRARGGHRE